MGAWRVEQHYGIGAANLRLSAEPYAHPDRRWSVLEGLGRLRDELHREGRSLRRSLGMLPALALVLTVLVSFVVTVVRDRVDDSGVEVVVWTATPEPPPAPPEPVVEPPPEPAPVEPAPPPPVVARTPPPPARPEPVAPTPPPPPKPAVARPSPPKPPPVRIDAIASAPKPPPPPVARAARRPVPEPVPSAAPRPEVAPLAAEPVPTRPEPVARRFAGVRPPPGERTARPDVRPSLAALPAAPEPAGARTPARVERTRPTGQGRPAAPRPDLAPAAPALPVPSSAPRARTARVGVAAPAAPERGRPSVRVAALAAPGSSSPRSPAPASPARAARGAVPTPGAAASHAAAEPSLAGVPLGSLAACVSDREEDALKQRVVAAVTTQEHCVSAAGTYRFVETKNLNSFLMWVEPARGRAQGDRCDELRLALSCLRSGSRR